MKKSKFTETEIIKTVKDHELGRVLIDLCLEIGIHFATINLLKKKYLGLKVQKLKWLKELEEKNRKI